MKTYITLLQGEERTIGLAIRDQNDSEWEPPGNVYYSVVDYSDGNTVIPKTACFVADNRIYCFISAAEVTDNIGEYEIIWEIEGEGRDLFYHKTKIFVGDL